MGAANIGHQPRQLLCVETRGRGGGRSHGDEIVSSPHMGCHRPAMFFNS
jgi:hypothetical protein